MKNLQNRRVFLTRASVASAGVAVGLNTFGSAESSRIFGANDRIRTGFIGIGNRGSQLLGLFMKQPDCEIAALCDVYEPYRLRDRKLVDPRFLKDLSGQVPKMGESFQKNPDVYSDYRRLLDDKTIDAVCIATPDHWHALQMTDSVAAGKDVYVEKPLTNTLWEGRQMVKAWEAGSRIVSVGLNRRGNPVYQKLASDIQAGKIGKVTVARSGRINNMFPFGIGKMQPEQPPKGLDWDLWLGPRANRPYQYNIAPYKFRWWSDFSSQMGNWGVHYMDVTRWMMGETSPVAVTACGGKYVLDHDGDIPDTMQVTFEFASGAIISFCIYEASSGNLFPYGEVELRGTKGTLYADEGGYRVIPASNGQFQQRTGMADPEEYDVKKNMLIDGSSGDSTANLVRNFLDCIKSRQQPFCTLEEGHRSTSFAHLANIALKVKQRLTWDAVNERFTNSEPANELLRYEYRNPWKL